uniref:ly6/PLAUR domain-containing protein 2-like n=1 Tax=Euleptes europaea TaxID=460621 RepID=UPI002541667E|nr:ly6/PLAUR domain-containing protein 2-like [Euleptes europaea]
MRTCLVALLIFVAALERALCLWCYTCNDPTDRDNCMTITNCSVHATACMTMLDSENGYPFFGIIAGTKSCAEKCVPSDPYGTDDCYPVSCCYTDLCNGAGASQATASLSTLGFSVVVALVGTRL